MLFSIEPLNGVVVAAVSGVRMTSTTELLGLLAGMGEAETKLLDRCSGRGRSPARLRTTARAEEGSIVDEEPDLLIAGRLG